jgi:hypothetical protein
MTTLVPIELPEPPLGERMVSHDAEFTAVDRGWSLLRDAINDGIRLANSVGAGLPMLPTESLEELLELPFSGDYRMIRRNAHACGQVRDALAVWSDNFPRVGLGVASCWSGAASAALLGRLAVYAVAGRAVGELVGAGASVFDEIATVCERLAVRVEHELVELGRVLLRLSRRLLEAVCGPGAASLAITIAVHGWSVISDIVHDICLVHTLISDLLTLQDTVTGWVADWRARLELFSELRHTWTAAA